MMMKVVISAKAGIQIEDTGFRIKSGMTKCVRFFLRQYTSFLQRIKLYAILDLYLINPHRKGY